MKVHNLMYRNIKEYGGFMLDHTGKEFKTKGDMCSYWGVTHSNFCHRLNRGWSMEEALTGKRILPKMIEDHKGNKFKTLKEMCDYWDVSYSTYRNARALDMSIEESLSKKRLVIRDHKGVVYKNTTEMCNAWDKNINTFWYQKTYGNSIEDILENKVIRRTQIKSIDHLGNEFSSRKEMYEYWGVSCDLFYNRKNKGWSLEKILTK